ncbi:MAG: hypothetical protein R6X35_16390 [Candidatus Krumholzibacteriia bacterium]
MRRRLIDALPLLAVAVLGHLPVLGAWWFHDDWVFLADAAGIVPRGDGLVRPVTYQLYWSALWPLFGLTPWLWAATRLALHAGAAVLVARLAGHGGLDRHGQLVAGLLFAAAPVAFESLAWGTGAVELLGAVFALAAVERWLAGGRRARWAALALAAFAVLSKESGLLLVVFFAFSLGREGRLRSPLAAGTAALAFLGAWAALQVVRDFDTTADYAIVPGLVPRNLLVLGSWLLTPGPLLRDSTLTATVGLAAGAVAWGLWGLAVQATRPERRPFAAGCLGLGLLALLPAAVTGDHAVPRYVYAPFAAVAVGAAVLVYPARGPSRRTLVLLTVLLLAGTAGSTLYQQDARHPSGRPLHRLVFKEEVSRLACRTIIRAGIGPGEQVVFLRDEGTDAGQMALLEDVLAGDRALRLLAWQDAAAVWRDRPDPADRGAFVFLVRGAMLVPRGRAAGDGG